MGKEFSKLRFMGLALGGGKSNRTHLAIIDYFLDEKKVFLSHVYRDIGEARGMSGDSILVNLIEQNSENLQAIGVDAPLSAPKCILEKGPIASLEESNDKEILWMWEHHQKQDAKKRPNKIFTPYTERCVEQYISTSLEQPFPMDHALGSNRAPIWARAQFLKRRLNQKNFIETYPRLSVWRLGRSLKISKNPLLLYKNSVRGAQHRQVILEKLIDSEWVFIYSQDVKHMVKDVFVFEAMISGFTAFLNHKKLCESPPKGFPKGAAWIAYPKVDFADEFFQ